MGVVGQNMEFDDRLNGTLAGDTLNAPKARILLMLALTQWNDQVKLQQCFDTY
jgi:L-asparaginase